ncbi:MAG: hypothetical protein NVSMB25_20450 [Thermoleophilaceae bacterium]
MRGTSEIESDIVPLGAYRLPAPMGDGVLRRDGQGGLVRAFHREGECVVVRAFAVAGGIRLRAQAPTRATAAHGIDRMRFALALDHDPRPFQRRFARDPLLGPVIRRRPWLRPPRRGEPFEALAWAITEQLIEVDRARAIQRRLVHRYGRSSACGTSRDAPSATVLADRAPAELQACDLSGARAIALIRASREVARGRVDLDDLDRAERRLGRIAGIGPWTLEKLALEGQGRDDRIPAGDLSYIKLVGALARLGRRATIDEVHEFFAPYSPYRGLAGSYLLAGSFGAPRFWQLGDLVRRPRRRAAA